MRSIGTRRGRKGEDRWHVTVVGEERDSPAQSHSWLPNAHVENGLVWGVRFARKDCTPCIHRSQCAKAKQEPRIVGLQAREPHDTLQTARQRQTTDTFCLQYAARAGIESATGRPFAAVAYVRVVTWDWRKPICRGRRSMRAGRDDAGGCSSGRRRRRTRVTGGRRLLIGRARLPVAATG